MLLVMALLALPPPTPGGAVLDDISARERLLLAQSPSPDEERDLEQDMESAKRRLGHGDKPAASTSPEAGKQPEGTPRPEAGVGQGAPKTRGSSDTPTVRRRERRRSPPGPRSTGTAGPSTSPGASSTGASLAACGAAPPTRVS